MTGAWIALALIALPVPVVRAQFATPLLMSGLPDAGESLAPSKPQMLAMLKIIDSYLHTFTVVRDNAAIANGSSATDPSGRTLADDLQRYCLPPAVQQNLAAERTSLVTAVDSGQLSAAIADLQTLEKHAAAAANQCGALELYWRQIVVAAPDWGPYLEMLRSNHVVPHETAGLEALAARFDTEASQGQYTQAMLRTWPQLQALRAKAFAEDRRDLAKTAMAPDFQGLYEQRATQPCTPAASSTSGTSAVALDPNYHAPSVTYPKMARSWWQEGSVRVGIIVSPHGCARSTFVLESSGYPLLDRAAVEYAAKRRFLPAERDGGAIETLAVMPFNFLLSKP